MDDLLDESERALEEDDVAWCALVHLLLLPVVEREIMSDGALAKIRIRRGLTRTVPDVATLA